MPTPEMNGAVVDMATDAPPEGEQGTASPSAVYYDNTVWGAYNVWSEGQGSPSETQLQAMLDKDGKAQALEAVLTLPLRWAPPEIVPHKDDSGEADFVEQALTTPPWDGGMSTPLEQIIAHMTGAVVFRKAYFEKVWRVAETEQGLRWVYDKLAPRPAETCRLVRDPKTGNFRGFKQRVPYDHPNADENGEIRFGPEKAFVYVHDWAKHPLCGRSALETAYRAFEAKQKIRWLWFAFLERHATPWAEARDETDPQGSAALARKVASLKGGGVVGMGAGQSMQLHEPASEGAAFKDCMNWLSVEMGESVLAGFLGLTTEQAGHGSYALSDDQSDFFLRSRYADLGEMGSALTTFVLSDLVRWNFPDGKTPTFRFGRLSHEHVEQALTLLQTLAAQSQPNPQIPAGFVDLLLEKVAATLDLDMAKLRQMLESRGAPTDPSTPEGLDNLTSGAVALVREAGLAPTTSTAA